MSLLDQLWDDTVAGPPPETGLGKLRRHHTFSSRKNPGKESDVGAPEDGIRVTRSIMIMKPQQGASQTGSPPISPAGSTPPVSPFAELMEQEEARRPFGLGGGRYRTSMRRQMELDPGAHVLLTTYDM